MAASPTSVTKKLQIKANNTVRVINAPDGFELGDLPEGAKVVDKGNGPFDCVQLFVYTKADVDTHAAKAIKAVKPGGLLWIAYPKKSGAIKTDINRDSGWEAVHGAGWESVRLISLDDTWSSMRFRPLAEISRITRKFGPNARKDEA